MRSHHKANRFHFEQLEHRRLLSFVAPLAFDTASSPASVAVGDVNGDGLLDFVTASAGSDIVSVHLGKGDGSFKAQRTFYAGGSPRCAVLGDVNGDGRLDIAVANVFNDTVGVLVGNGDGTFEDVRAFAAGGSPISVVAAHVNGDGLLDLVVANSEIVDGTVSVLLGNGNGSFQTPRTFASGGSVPKSVAVGDVNGDGRLDLAVANQGYFGSGPGVSVLLGNGDGTFGAARNFFAGTEPRWVEMEDVNGDGRVDLAVANYFGAAVRVFLGNGDGTFQAAQVFIAGYEPRSVAVRDLNGDGRLDLAVPNTNSDNVSVLLGNGDGTFQDARNFRAGSRPESMAVEDVNRDGLLDLVVANQGSSNVCVLLGSGDGTFRSVRNFTAGVTPIAVAVGDVNGDGNLDVAAANSAGTVNVLVSNGDGTFQPVRSFAAGSSAWSVAMGDVNGDGLLDLAVANGGGTVSVLVGNGDGTFQAVRSFPAASLPRSLALGDVNGDGRLDVIVAGHYSNDYESYDVSVRVLLGNGDGTFEAPRQFAAGNAPRAVALGDFNGDGHLDLAVGNDDDTINTDHMSVLLGNGDGTFQAARNFAAGSYLQSVAVADLNGDGRLDLAAARTDFGGAVSVLLGNGDGTFQAARYFSAGGGWWPSWRGPSSVTVADVNGDGRLDLAVTSSGTVRVLLGNGDGTFQTTYVSYVAGRSPLAVAAADFNGDGKADLAAANNFSDDVSILLNDGNWTTKTWISQASGGSWSTAANWSPSGVPAASDQALIGGGRSVTLNSSAIVSGIALSDGAQLIVGANGNRLFRASKISIDATSWLDLNDNDLILDYQGATPLSDILALLARGRGPAPTGILSSTANASAGSLVLGVAEASKALGITVGQSAVFSGQTVDATTVLIKHTVKGDLNLDGSVSFVDLIAVASNFGKTGAIYSDGDLNHDGAVTFADLIDVAANFGKTLPPPAPALEPVTAQSISIVREESTNVLGSPPQSGRKRPQRRPGALGASVTL